MSIWGMGKQFFNKKQTTSTDFSVQLNSAASPTALKTPTCRPVGLGTAMSVQL